jgi:glycosyltransferase involved in cell wall biosynthesis
MKTVLVSWGHQGYERRCELFAQRLHAPLHYISYGQSGKLLQAPLRYVMQARKTWLVLHEERPDIVFVQNPPIFCAMAAFFYGWRRGARYVIDSHTGAFLSPRWRWSLGLHRLLSYGALMTIVHNKSIEEIVKSWRCRYTVMADPMERDYPAVDPFRFDGEFNVAVVSSYQPDEPTGVVFEAARKLPDVCFYFTGDSGRLDSRLLAKKPDNCHLTGYLPNERYIGLLRGAEAAMVLTTRNHTVLAGAFEAVSLGIPLITSDWPVLKDAFSLGTVHIPNTVQGVYGGVRRAQLEQATLRRDVLVLREKLQSEWTQKFAELQHMLEVSQGKNYCMR